MLQQHEPQASVSAAFSSSSKLSRVFYNSMEVARAVDVMRARVKRNYTLMDFFFVAMFSKSRKHVLRVLV